MAEIIEFVSSSIASEVAGNIAYNGLKNILGSSFDMLSKFIKNNQNKEFEGALKMLLEQNKQLKKKIEELMQETEYKKEEPKTIIHQKHYGEGDIVGRDKITYSSPKS